eukprot:scaffold38715_cov31-Tisochrysis_lutea.AAC.5
MHHPVPVLSATRTSSEPARIPAQPSVSPRMGSGQASWRPWACCDLPGLDGGGGGQARMNTSGSPYSASSVTAISSIEEPPAVYRSNE